MKFFWLVAVCVMNPADGRSSALEIGPARTTVAETVLAEVPEGIGDVQIPGLPPALDLHTLRVMAMDPRIGVHEWRPLPRAYNPAPDAMSVLRVCLQAGSAISGTPLRLDYATAGLAWSAHYRLRFAGDLVVADRLVTGALQGVVRIYNNTGRAWTNALVTLVSGSLRKMDEPARQAGFLMIDRRDPLSDLWTSEGAAPELSYRYRLPDALLISARGSRVVPWCSVTNCLVAIRYRTTLGMEDLQIPRPLSRWLEVQNLPLETPSLPAGQLQIDSADTNAFPAAMLRVEHTESGGRMAADLGPAPLVTARREYLGRGPGQPGYREETFILKLTNALAAAVAAEVVDTPPVVLEWDVTSCTHKFRREGKQLVFQQLLAPSSSEHIRYTVRVREAKF